jgi:hypothetical protein
MPDWGLGFQAKVLDTSEAKWDNIGDDMSDSENEVPSPIFMYPKVTFQT